MRRVAHPASDAACACASVHSDCSFDDTCELAETDNALSRGKTVLIGMPGAFTPTCTDAHLPGFIRNARRFRRAGVNNLAVVTTNDRFVS